MNQNTYTKSGLMRLSQGNYLRNLFILFLTPSLAFMLSCDNAAEELAVPSTDADLSAVKSSRSPGVNVLLNTTVTSTILNELRTYGTVLDVIPEINALTMVVTGDKLSAIRQLSYVGSANSDAQRNGAPVDAVAVTDFATGISTWNLDAVNVTNHGVAGRTVKEDGTGVYIGVLDTGLSDSWRQYFPEERIATQYAKSFSGGGGEMGAVSEQPNKWEHDQNSHGTHVTSTIIGFNLRGAAVNGVAPKATVVPVKVLNQNGSGWSSVIARGIVYMASLKEGPLKNNPVVINMSLGGSVLDAVEKAAIDYAISKGVVIVASAGNSGTAGMGYPGAYAPVISVASAGLKNINPERTWWYTQDVADPTVSGDFVVADYSSRAKAGQDLDVMAPGSSIVGPYQINSGQLSYYFLSGTSMASPHVAGIVALMMQKNPGLDITRIESILEGATLSTSWAAADAGQGLITADAALSAL